MAYRRLLTIPLYIFLTLSATALLPLLVLIGLILSVAPQFRGVLPTIGFVFCYLWCETIGITSSLYIWLRYRDRRAFLMANYHLQCWWANSLKVSAEKLYRLTFVVENQEALLGDPAIMLPRHASIADTIIPMVFYAIPQKVRLRYVLKKELLLDPCLDIVGRRLPNYFVDRDGQDSEQARRGVAALLANLESDEGALIYPEGTRFSQAKHAALRVRYRESPEMLAQLDRYQSLLPPRLGGTLAMLSANPGLDVIFCAHAGFEGSSRFADLLNGSWVGAKIWIRFWRIDYADVPGDPAGQQVFLFQEWDRMQKLVSPAKLG